jgi:hypothetical protein
MEAPVVNQTTILILSILGGLAILAAFIGGIVCLVKYARTRKIGFLIAGLVLTLIIPGCICLALVLLLVPSTMVVYGPPPQP